MEGDLSDREIPDEQIQPPSRDDLPDADPALVRRGRVSPYPPRPGQAGSCKPLPTDRERPRAETRGRYIYAYVHVYIYIY